MPVFGLKKAFCKLLARRNGDFGSTFNLYVKYFNIIYYSLRATASPERTAPSSVAG